MNCVRIYRRPEYIFSDYPEGKTPDEDPFTYYNNGSRRMLGNMNSQKSGVAENEVAAVKK